MKNYDIIQKIGQGKFGTVYMAKHKKTEEPVAIKCESVDNPYKSIKHETTILNYLYRCGCRCIPKVLYYGIHENQVCLIMKYFTISWEDYVKTAQINRKQLNRIMIACIHILREIHKHNILHRDIKPSNFMFWEKQLFLIDFGMAISFTPEDNCEDPIKDHIIGTPKYVSYFVHDGYTSRPRDDLISLGYTYMSFLMNLPWSSQPSQNSSISQTHITHPCNVFRKNEKSWEKMMRHCSQESQLLKYFDYCYHKDTLLDYEFLCNLFL
jgi:serine/threonine protein kinase